MVALLAWAISGEAVRFLAVLVIATPCPLLLGIPIAIIGSISLCARRAIIVKNPVVLEQIAQCRTAIFDKTGTLTYGEPKLNRTTHRSWLCPKGGSCLGSQPGTLFEASAGPCHSRPGERGRTSAPANIRGKRTSRSGSARNRVRSPSSDHQPQ